MKKEKSFLWPNGCQGAISLTFDDGLPSQLKTAVPLLNEYGFRGTFYLSPTARADWQDRLAPWRDVVQFGHEIGNHSLSHRCSCNFSGDPNHHGLENMSLKEIESDIIEARRRLETIFPEKKNWTYAYPCYQDFVGKGKTRQSYVPIIARHFTAARGIGELVAANSPFACDLHFLWSWPIERMSGAEMIGLTERAVALGRWGILTIHGINEGHLTVSDVDLRELLVFLDRNRNRIWTAPLLEVAKHIIENAEMT